MYSTTANPQLMFLTWLDSILFCASFSIKLPAVLPLQFYKQAVVVSLGLEVDDLSAAPRRSLRSPSARKHQALKMRSPARLSRW